MAEMMKAGVLAAPKTIEIREILVPQIEPDIADQLFRFLVICFLIWINESVC